MIFPYYTVYSAPIGELYLAAAEDGLRGIWFVGGKYVPGMTGERLEPEHALFREAVRWLDDYFAGRRPDPARVKIAPQGSAFRQRVWREMGKIPYGDTTTYGAIARTLERESGKRVSAQAVGGAVAHNPISILLPCHRVLGSDGGLTGYAGGLERKTWLLNWEGRATGLPEK